MPKAKNEKKSVGSPSERVRLSHVFPLVLLPLLLFFRLLLFLFVLRGCHLRLGSQQMDACAIGLRQLSPNLHPVRVVRNNDVICDGSMLHIPVFYYQFICCVPMRCRGRFWQVVSCGCRSPLLCRRAAPRWCLHRGRWRGGEPLK